MHVCDVCARFVVSWTFVGMCCARRRRAGGRAGGQEDPFNIDLIEKAGFVERAKMLRAREAKREKALQQWAERKEADDRRKVGAQLGHTTR